MDMDVTGIVALHKGSEAAEAGDLATAEIYLRRALAETACAAEAAGLLAELYQGAKRLDEALESYAMAARLAPEDSRWLPSRARLCLESGDTAGAVADLKTAVQRFPGRPALLVELAEALTAAGQGTEAVPVLREALSLSPEDRYALCALASALLDQDQPLEAAPLWQRAVRARPDDAAGYLGLGRAYQALGEPGRATDALTRAAGLDGPAAEQAVLLLAALDDAPTDLPPAYVRILFDQYADRFDSALLGTLEYRVPALLAALLNRALPPPVGNLSVMDLGCGTGLAGVILRPYASSLAGLDLSEKMLEKAAERRIYDRLIQADLTAAMRAAPETYDLAVAADVLVYIGDLHPVLAAIAVALRPGGVLAATIESPSPSSVQLADDGGFALGPKRRFVHGRAHLESAAAAAGLATISIEPATLRREKGEPVSGQVFLLRKDLGQQA